jgi:hypothetical protein
MIEVGCLFGRSATLSGDLKERLQVVNEEVNYDVDSCIFAGPRRRCVLIRE